MPAFVAVGVVLLATAVWLTQPWNFKTDQRLQLVESVAQAYNGLRALETFQYRMDVESNDGLRLAHLIQVDNPKQIKYEGLWIEGSDPDTDPPTVDGLVIGRDQYRRAGGGASEEEWRPVGQVGPWAPLGDLEGLPWKGTRLQGKEFEEVRRLPAEVLQGELVEHYLASRTVTDGPLMTTRDTLELWVGAQDGLLRRVVWLHQNRWSQPEEVLGPDKNWCEDPTGHLPDGLIDMVVFDGEPGSTDLTVDPSPGHSLQPMKIVCFGEDRTRGRVVWELSKIPSGEEGYDQTVRKTYTFSGFDQPLAIPVPLP